jgi:hypothetical protein
MMSVMAKHTRNEETPLRSFRLPTPEADRQLVKAAAAAGITVSAFIRRSLAAAITDTNR